MIWAFRLLMLALISATISWKLASPPAPEVGDTGQALSRVLAGRLSGPVRVQAWGPNDKVFSAPLRGCVQPLVIVPIGVSFSAAPALEQFHRPGAHERFAYLDWTMSSPDRWGLLRRQFLERVRVLAGLSPYGARQTLLFIDEPVGCAPARSIPWAGYWLGRP
jgi:hypothetical protein